MSSLPHILVLLVLVAKTLLAADGVCQAVLKVASNTSFDPTTKVWVATYREFLADGNQRVTTDKSTPFFDNRGLKVSWFSRTQELLDSSGNRIGEPFLFPTVLTSNFIELSPRAIENKVWSLTELFHLKNEGFIILAHDEGALTHTLYTPIKALAPSSSDSQLISPSGSLIAKPNSGQYLVEQWGVDGKYKNWISDSPPTSRELRPQRQRAETPVVEVDRSNAGESGDNPLTRMERDPAAYYREHHGVTDEALSRAKAIISARNGAKKVDELAINLAIVQSTRALEHVKNANQFIPGLRGRPEEIILHLEGNKILDITLDGDWNLLRYHDLIASLSALRKQGFSEEADRAARGIIQQFRSAIRE